VSQDRLGLFDTPPDQRQIRLSVAIVCLLCAVMPLIIPVRGTSLPQLGAFVPMVDAIMFMGEAITATLLFAQAAVFRSRALGVLAAGFLLTALLLIPHALTLPGAFAPNGLLDAGVNTTAWIAYSRRWTFPIAVILYVLLKRADVARPETERPPVRVFAFFLAAVAIAAAVTLVTTVGHDLLPTYFANRSYVFLRSHVFYQIALLAAFIVAGIMLYRARKSVLDMWLLVAVSGWVVETLLTIALPGRYTLGWYWTYAVVVFTNLIVMLALVAESNRLYARLALATIARNRERSARLMSLDAVAAAISHEIGQPLTAIRLQAGISRSRLSAPKPDIGSAINALDAILEAEHRTSDVLKSIRAMFGQRRGGRTEFNLNELTRATMGVMDRDLAAHRVSLELALDEDLPSVLADPVQIQRVLVNLLTNAIESLDAVTGRPRLITVRSTAVEGQAVLLEITDNGAGIAPDTLDQIFEVYFTTKATGIGLGLSLCRIIVEACGGRLWASRGQRYGATFHLQLPRSTVFAQ
jgi:signal transduction histidine kinase